MTDLSKPALRTFDSIAERWGLSEQESLAILGLEHRGERIRQDTLERMSHILGIFRAINTLLPVRERADGWLRAANTAPIFSGRAPIDLLATGNIEDLKMVRRYLGGQIEGPYL